MMPDLGQWAKGLALIALVGVLSSCQCNSPADRLVGTWRDTMFDAQSGLSTERKAALQSRLVFKEGGAGTYSVGDTTRDHAAQGLRPAQVLPLSWTINGNTVSYRLERDPAGKSRTAVLAADGKTLTVNPGRKFVREH